MRTEKAKALKVPKKKGECIRTQLRDADVIRTDLCIAKDEKYLYFPLRSDVETDFDYPVLMKSFVRRKQRISSYKDKIIIPEDLKDLLPTSFDVIGSILLIKIPKELMSYKKEIGNALLGTHAHIETVCLMHPVCGELRTRNVEVIAGKKTTRTMHKEYGLTFHVDVENTYFSPRLANERYRIAQLVQPNECVVDMFTGVAPFPVMIARFAQPSRIIAVDKNREAVKLARKNIVQNKVLDIVDVFFEDAACVESVMKKNQRKADRIIMNLPFQSYHFFPYALHIMNNTCMIHYYEVLQEEKITSRIQDLIQLATEEQVSIQKTKVHRIKTYAPREFYIGIDITAQKK